MENNKSSKDKVSIIIVTFKSEHIIEKCLDNIGSDYNVILVENSDNRFLTSRLKFKYKNLDTINIGYDSGFGYALNRGIEKAKTDYIISINPDSFPEKDCFQKLIITADNYDQAVMITPITYIKNNSEQFSDYGYFKKKKLIKDKSNKMEVDWVNGNVFLLKKKNYQRYRQF